MDILLWEDCTLEKSSPSMERKGYRQQQLTRSHHIETVSQSELLSCSVKYFLTSCIQWKAWRWNSPISVSYNNSSPRSALWYYIFTVSYELLATSFKSLLCLHIYVKIRNFIYGTVIELCTLNFHLLYFIFNILKAIYTSLISTQKHYNLLVILRLNVYVAPKYLLFWLTL